MSSIRKLKNGRHQADYQDTFRGIQRTKRTFDTKKEAEEWLAAVKTDATARLLGRQRRSIFGESLAHYLREDSPKKASHRDDVVNARALRWPIWDPKAGRWLRLEETALEDVPAVLAQWVADLREVRDRRYLDNRVYHLRPAGGGEFAWFHQPDPDDTADKAPKPRTPVRDPALLLLLDTPERMHLPAAPDAPGPRPPRPDYFAAPDVRARWRQWHLAQGLLPGRGPFSSGTLRTRQLLVRRILFLAWKHWGTLQHNIAPKVQLEAKSLPREEWLEAYDQLLALVIAAPPGFDAAILAAAWIGWRKSNLLQLEWPRVVFPIHETRADGSRAEVQPGYLWVPRKNVKGQARPIVYPMVPHIEQLFRLLWEARAGWDGHHYVFHRGDGRPFKDFRHLWTAAKRAAGIDPGFRWHGLRHTWTSWALQAGGDSKRVAELGGWTTTQMVEQVYGHIRTEHLRGVAELSKRTH